MEREKQRKENSSLNTLLKGEYLSTSVNRYRIHLGCDPEFFFKSGSQRKRAIGSELILPKRGLMVNDASKFIIDGVQAELNPRPNLCRAYLGNEIGRCFIELRKALETSSEGKKRRISTCFDGVVKVPKTELAKLDAEMLKLGCAPSKNIDKNVDASVMLKSVDPHSEDTERFAGGHIHLGFDEPNLVSKVQTDPILLKRMVNLLDILVGNTCVLIDRAPSSKRRRKFYGRAGEYRLPPHGLEYRVPSNFWLRHASLLSLVFGMARFAADIAITDSCHKTKPPYYKIFIEALGGTSLDDEEEVMDKVRAVINENSFSKAYENYLKIEPVLEAITRDETGWRPILSHTLPLFRHFIKNVAEKGLEHYFPEDPMDFWTTTFIRQGRDTHKYGFNTFLKRVVLAEKQKEERILAKNGATRKAS